MAASSGDAGDAVEPDPLLHATVVTSTATHTDMCNGARRAIHIDFIKNLLFL